ncbi:hypothetical protein MDA_GLEAN10023436 [Myotis davidii]|uniref:Uncharacterized protein n=1 Tax=Myotis davidii TaxID=225400 RepID=L5MBN2_MYODS|nr:hypothetical protein MDA_GLEAN10023436 [Myotis davidii]
MRSSQPLLPQVDPFNVMSGLCHRGWALMEEERGGSKAAETDSQVPVDTLREDR